jgi:hypothetical protein
MSEPWPYNLPIFRRAHRVSSPDGEIVAEIDEAFELGMSNPTCGTLRLSTGLQLDRCNPSFIWSEDSRYLAVPRYFVRLGLFRRQRMVVIDTVGRKAFASPQTTFYYQPDSFSGGLLVVTKEPTRLATRVTWRIPEELATFADVALQAAQPVAANGAAAQVSGRGDG